MTEIDVGRIEDALDTLDAAELAGRDCLRIRPTHIRRRRIVDLQLVFGAVLDDEFPAVGVGTPVDNRPQYSGFRHLPYLSMVAVSGCSRARGRRGGACRGAS